MIYIDRTIIILNNEATIEQPIVLYKGDKNVQLLFQLKDNYLKYKSMENAYGQLIIKRKTASPIFSEVARLSSNKVTFVVTEEMIDELNEVGEYEFQIRLFSQDKTSRATLPPVANGIMIREPILEEEVPNEVGVATVNEVEVVAEDTELEVFDENGDYIKTEWKHKDIITDVKLNKIEEAIYEINEKEVDLTDYALKKDVPSIKGLATETYVQEQIAQAELGGEEEVDLSIYATKENPTFTGTFSLNRKANSTVGDKSVALGSNVVASGMNSTAIGLMSQATGLVSTAIGSGNKANGSSSMALGMGTIATGDYQLVHGRNNIEDTEDKYLHIVGNGKTGEPSNAYTLDFDGNGVYSGKLTVGVEPTEEKDVATKKYVDSKFNSATTQGIYVTKTELTETLGVYVTEEELEGKGFATETYVTNAIANAQLGGEDTEVDLSGYATKDDLNAKADKEHTHSQYLTEHQDISGKVDKVEGKSLVLNTEIERLATLENYNDTEIRGLIEGKADENHTHEGYLTEHQDISHLATKEELFSGSYNDLTDKPTIPSIEGLATETYVDEAIANIDIPTVEDTIVTVTATTLTTDKYQYTTISGDTEIALPTVTTFKEIHLFFNLSSDFANTITLYSTNQIRYQQELEFEGGNAYELVCTFVPNMYWLVGLVKYEGEVASASGGSVTPPTIL